jgi:DNA-binding NtrC family response regulator
MVEEAANGTLFLDEIGDLGISSQTKLLRLLQEGEYFPLGSDRPKRLQARVIVATHRDLAAREAAGAFRRDLYYRLRTHSVHVPPLRERKGDIALLLNHFLGEAARSLGKKKPTPPRELAQLLTVYSFPGNVRELRAMVYDAVTLHKERVLSMDSFVRAISATDGVVPLLAELPLGNPFTALERLPTFSEVIELLIDEAMTRSSGNQTIAARLLGVSQPALSKRLKSARK